MRTEPDLHLLGLLILLRLVLDRRNLSPHAPGDLGDLVDDMHLRNLHDFLQSGCSEHLRLHLRIFRVRDWLLDLFLLHNWDFSHSFNELPQFSVPLALLAPAPRFQESQSKIDYDSSSAFCTVRIGDLYLCCTCGTLTVGINVCTFTEMSMNCSLVNLHGILDGLDNWNLRNRNLESVEFLFDWSLG